MDTFEIFNNAEKAAFCNEILYFYRLRAGSTTNSFSKRHLQAEISVKNFCEKVPYKQNSNGYLFPFETILQAGFFNLKYGEISISSSYKGYIQSCGYFDGFIYLLGNFKVIMLFFLAKLNIYKHKLFK